MEIGPVDVLVVAFPGNQFNGAILPALSDLVRAGTVRLLDLLFVYKDADGAVGALELNEIAAQFGPVPLAEDAGGGLLDAEDVEEVGAGLEPNSSVALLFGRPAVLGELLGGAVCRRVAGLRCAAT